MFTYKTMWFYTNGYIPFILIIVKYMDDENL